MKGTPLEVIPGILVLILLVGCIQLPPAQPEDNVTACPELYSPACGIDNVTYNNSCYAQKAGVTIAYYGECKEYEPTPTCTDSDAGNNVLKAGNTSLNSLVKFDVCIDASTINEYYCSNNQIVNQTQACPSGYVCSNAKCIKEVIPPVCTDTDNGTDYTTAGAVYDNGIKYSDVCIMVDLVKEYYCSNGSVTSTNIACPSGYQCTNGACIEQEAVCSDSDLGKDKFSKGTTTLTKGYSIFTSATDECVDEDRVREYYCSNNAVISEIIECGEDYGCVNGRCKSLTCEDSDYGQDALTKGVTKKGSDSETDKCSGTYNVKEYYCKNNDIESTIITCPSGRVCSGGKCVLEETCSETDGGNDIYNYGVTTKGSQTEYDSCSGPISLLEYYCSNNDIQSDMVSCPLGYMCEGNECVKEPLCTDTDGGKDYLTKGTVFIGVDSISDACLDPSTLIERFCVGDTYDSEEVVCTFPNQVCSNGACVGIVLPP
jgi:hypothetical protein